jgi:hypothetical protein
LLSLSSFALTSATNAATSAAAGANPTNAALVARIWDACRDALGSVRLLREAPAYWITAVGDQDDAGAVSLRFWLIALLGLLAALLVGWAIYRLLDRSIAAVDLRAGSRLRAALLRLTLSLVGVLVFATLLWIALVAASAGNRLLEETADRVVRALIERRLAILALIVVFSPSRGDLRLLVDGRDADLRCGTK